MENMTKEEKINIIKIFSSMRLVGEDVERLLEDLTDDEIVKIVEELGENGDELFYRTVSSFTPEQIVRITQKYDRDYKFFELMKEKFNDFTKDQIVEMLKSGNVYYYGSFAFLQANINKFNDKQITELLKSWKYLGVLQEFIKYLKPEQIIEVLKECKERVGVYKERSVYAYS